MNGEIPVQQMTLIAAADLSSSQYLAVKIDSDGKAALAGAGENAVGILQTNPKAGFAGQVMALGQSYAVYGASVTAGNNLSADASGKLVPTAGTAAVLAVAMESGSADEVHTVILITRTSAGNNQHWTLAIPVKLKNIAANTDILTDWIPGFAGSIKKLSFAVTDPATTESKSAVINIEIEATNLTGGVLTLNSANCTPLGKVVDATAITAANVFSATQKISIEAGAVTAFVEGEGVLLIVIG
jgi:hypothetical protein